MWPSGLAPEAQKKREFERLWSPFGVIVIYYEEKQNEKYVCRCVYISCCIG